MHGLGKWHGQQAPACKMSSSSSSRRRRRGVAAKGPRERPTRCAWEASNPGSPHLRAGAQPSWVHRAQRGRLGWHLMRQGLAPAGCRAAGAPSPCVAGLQGRGVTPLTCSSCASRWPPRGRPAGAAGLGAGLGARSAARRSASRAKPGGRPARMHCGIWPERSRIATPGLLLRAGQQQTGGMTGAAPQPSGGAFPAAAAGALEAFTHSGAGLRPHLGQSRRLQVLSVGHGHLCPRHALRRGIQVVKALLHGDGHDLCGNNNGGQAARRSLSGSRAAAKARAPPQSEAGSRWKSRQAGCGGQGGANTMPSRRRLAGPPASQFTGGAGDADAAAAPSPDPTPCCGQPSSTDTRRCVLRTLAAMASRSIGFKLRRLTTSAEMPSCSSSSAAFRQYPTILLKATRVTSLPLRMTCRACQVQADGVCKAGRRRRRMAATKVLHPLWPPRHEQLDD